MTDFHKTHSGGMGMVIFIILASSCTFTFSAILEEKSRHLFSAKGKSYSKYSTGKGNLSHHRYDYYQKERKSKVLICFITAYKVIKIKNEVIKNVNE